MSACAAAHGARPSPYVRRVLELRRVGEDDWPAWRGVRQRALAEAPAAFGSTLAEWQGAGDTEARWRERLRAVPFNVIAEVAGTGVGQVSGTAPDADGIVDLISLWVAPDARGLGAGDALVDAVVTWSRDHGPSVRLWVKHANAPAIRLYERHGFVPTGHTEDDEVEMQRAVHAAGARRHPSRT